MDKRPLWSKIIGIVALMLMVVGFGLIMGGGRRLEHGGLLVFGIILAAVGAIISESSSRKLVLWGAGGTAASMDSRAYFRPNKWIERERRDARSTSHHYGYHRVSWIPQPGGNRLWYNRHYPRREATSVASNEHWHWRGPNGNDSGRPRKRSFSRKIQTIGRKKGLVWGGVAVAVPLLVIGIFLLTRGGEKTDEPQKLYAEGQYFTMGSTREEVLRIQGPPTFKLELVWFYGDSQVQFDSDGKVTNIWDVSKNLKVKSEKLP